MKLSRRAAFLITPFLPGVAVWAAQEKGTVESAETFRNTLTALARQLKAPILVEGIPLRVQELLPDANLNPARAADALREVAKANDYIVMPSNGCYLLIKQYTNPGDLPCITMAELRESLSLVEKAVRRFYRTLPMPEPANPRDRRDYLQFVLLKIYDLLKDHPARQGGDGAIPLNAAPPEIQELVWQAWIENSFGETISGVAYLAPFLADDALIVPGEKAAELFAKVVDKRPLPLTLFPGRPFPPANTRREQYTLAEAIKQRSATVAKKVECAPALADKPLMMLGSESTNEEVVARATGMLYRLSVTSNESQVLIAPRRVSVPTRIQDLGKYTSEVLPLPIARILFSEYFKEDYKFPVSASSKAPAVAAQQQAAWDCMAAGYRREREKSNMPEVSVRSLAPDEQSAYSLCVMRNLHELKGLAQFATRPFTGFLEKGQIFIRIQEAKNEKGEPRLGIQFLYPTPGNDSRLNDAFAISNLRPYGQ